MFMPDVLTGRESKEDSIGEKMQADLDKYKYFEKNEILHLNLPSPLEN